MTDEELERSKKWNADCTLSIILTGMICVTAIIVTFIIVHG